uniref:Polysaccharide biosynthesis protein C-terminal domain-containing protein n=1 Tax=Grammatophora oceanica TaxID=210454 RepID=A0A7S1UN78_9STRA|mmetsp:Transcript_13870/g.20304  ORF Transcript_13870/g.20304 Transcript_13870/m.20304 type:complete len:521 (+) Transcript_13870:47-1609(+)
MKTFHSVVCGASLLLSLQVVPHADCFKFHRARNAAGKKRFHNSRLRDSTASVQDAPSEPSLEEVATEPSDKNASKRDMMKFAIPALGIYLCNPLLSNIDNAFVGRTVGTSGLAALSPATVCTDQMLYLFSFLSRATTGLVSRAYAATNESNGGDKEAARNAASAPLTVSLMCGAALSVFYVFFTPSMLTALKVNPALRTSAASYIYWRGAIAAFALAQAVSLSVMMATRDAITPLKIVGLAALLNVCGDALLCVWPLRWGCAGAAAATSGATLLSSLFMLRALRRKGLLPKIRMPTKKELSGLLEFMGPLLAITFTRLGGFIVMQKSAMKLGVQPLAAYQLSINLLTFFLLFGEPLSQLSQTKLPALVDAEDGRSVLGNLKSVITLASFTSLGIAGVASLAVARGSHLFSSDLGVQLLARQAAPAIFASVATAIMTVAIDGAMLASRDFGFMLLVGLSTFILQIGLLKSPNLSLSYIFGTFTMRLGVYSVLAVLRVALGYGALGKVLRSRPGVLNGKKEQ